jgi:hypothetical protein
MKSGGTARRQRRAVAVLLVAATIVVAAFVYVVGVLSDWSGQHRVPVETTVGAAVILLIGVLVSLWIARPRS